MNFKKIGLTCAAFFLLSAVSIAAFAQDNGAGAAGGAAGGGGRRQRQGGFGGQRGGMNTLATVPVATLDSYLKLTADQKAKIKTIQDQYTTDTKALATPGGAAGGAGVDRQALQEARQKRQEAATKADTDIKAVLTEDQTKMLPDMNKELQALNTVGIPAGALGDLKLSSDQKTKITTIATDAQKDMQAKMQEARQNGGQIDPQAMQDMRKSASDKAMAVLNADQKTKLEAYLKEHPQPRFGGFGGQGGGRRQRGGAAGGANPPTL